MYEKSILRLTECSTNSYAPETTSSRVERETKSRVRLPNAEAPSWLNSTALVSQRSWAQIPFRPECFFQALISITA